MENQEIINYVLDFLRKASISDGEVYLIDSQAVKIKVLEEVLENLEVQEKRGAGIRVFQDNRVGFSFTSDLTKLGLGTAVRSALLNSRHTMKDEANVLPESSGKISNVSCYDPEQKTAMIKYKIVLAKVIERLAREYDERVVRFYGTSYEDAVGRVFIVNTKGIDYSYPFSQCVAWTTLIASDGSAERYGGESDFGLSISDINPKFIGERAAQNGIDRLGSKTYRTQKVDVVLDPEITADLFESFVPALCADSVLKNKSLFKGKIGEKIASNKVSLINDGTLKQGASSSPVDDEGIATRETVLIEEGCLRGWLHNFYTSQKMGVEPTGSAQRDYKTQPIVASSNLYLKPGRISREELIKEVKDGLCVSEVMGLHTIDPVSGDFSLGASGRVIKDGEFSYAVEGIAIAGNIIDLLNSIKEVANDLRFFSDGTGGETILLKNISVSGK